MGDDALDSVQYSIYLDACIPSSSLSDSASQELLIDLKHSCFRVLNPLIKGYIWQHDPFNLEIFSIRETQASASHVCTSHSYLGGTTKFGDNIEDEWFVVYLLYNLSREFPQISITVRDNDGEFLLIETAYVIPGWFKPENSTNRVFIRQGALHLLPLSISDRGKATIITKQSSRGASLSVEKAISTLKDGNFGTTAADEVQEAVARRIKEYPERAQKHMHKARCIVPIQIAHILKHEPQLISLAVDAFYRRDIDSMKAASNLRKFLQKQGFAEFSEALRLYWRARNGSFEDQITKCISKLCVRQSKQHSEVGQSDMGEEMVEVVVTLSRAMYAQLQQQVFAPPKSYPMLPVSNPHYKEAELGMKITCGFEMMYWERTKFETDEVGDASQGKRVREEGGRIKEMDGAPVDDPGWQVYKRSLENRGYFRGLLEGSREHTQLLRVAIDDYRATGTFASTSSAMHSPVKRINNILSLPLCASNYSKPSLQSSDDDSWLYDGDADLTSAIHERQSEIEAHELKRARHENANKKSGTYDSQDHPAATGSEPLYEPQDVVQSMQAFMNKISSFEGAELPDEEVSINMSRFMYELESVLGTTGLGAGPTEDSLADDFDNSDSDMESNSSDEDVPFESTGSTSAADLKKDASTSKVDSGFMDEYSDTLIHELQQTSLAKSFASAEDIVEVTKSHERPQENEGDESGIVDVDMNLVTSLLQSYMNQEGMPGPGSNLLGAMGIHLSNPSEKESGKAGPKPGDKGFPL